MSSMLSSVAPSALRALTTSGVLPAAACAGMRAFARSSSYLHLHAPHPVKEDEGKNSSSSSRTPWSTFPPELRELSRQAGGFEGPRRYPLGSHGSSMLLDHANLMTTAPLSYCLVRHHSVMPRSASQNLASQSVALAGLQAQQQKHAATAVLELPSQEAEGVLSKWFAKTQPRMKVRSLLAASSVVVSIGLQQRLVRSGDLLPVDACCLSIDDSQYICLHFGS